MATYKSVRSTLDTGDIVLFSGKGVSSSVIRWFTDSKWSHVGMVMRLEDWDMVLLWESTGLHNIKDIVTGKEKKGVQLVPLSGRLSTYKGKVAIRRLTMKRTKEMKETLKNLREVFKNKEYEKSEIQLLKAAYEGPFGENVEDLSSLFCSELIAEAYQRMGLLAEPPKGQPSNEFTPAEFSSENKDLKLLKKAELGKEIPITT